MTDALDAVVEAAWNVVMSWHLDPDAELSERIGALTVALIDLEATNGRD